MLYQHIEQKRTIPIKEPQLGLTIERKSGQNSPHGVLYKNLNMMKAAKNVPVKKVAP